MDSKLLAGYSLALVTTTLVIASAFMTCDTGPLHKIIATEQATVSNQQDLMNASVAAAKANFDQAKAETDALKDKYLKALQEAEVLKKNLQDQLKNCPG